jgi:hypothetical protein
MLGPTHFLGRSIFRAPFFWLWRSWVQCEIAKLSPL